jgi:hypothetical protein
LTPSALRSPAGVLLYLALAAALASSGCSLGSKKKAANNAGGGTPVVAASAVASPAAGVQATLPAGTSVATPPAGTPVRLSTPGAPVTPPPAVTPTPSPTPTAPATPAIRTEDGLQIQDVQFAATVSADGGLRIRSAPTLDAPVVASVGQGARVNVEAKILNGAEAESGKGTVWYQVGPKQYVYGAEGYLTPLQGTPSR